MSTNTYRVPGKNTAEDLRKQILSDLSTMGEVELVGEITPVNDEYFLDGVIATITPAAMSAPFKVKANWSTVEGLHYTRGGHRLNPPRRSYEDAADTSKHPGADVSVKIMERARTWVPSAAKDEVRMWKLFFSTNMIATGLAVLVALGLTFGTVDSAGMSSAYAESPVLTIALLAFIFFMTTLLVGYILHKLRELVVDPKIARSAARSWEKKSSKLFYDLFDTTEERQAFLEYLMEMCTAKGYRFTEKPVVHYSAATRYRENSPIAEPVVKFWAYAKEDYHTQMVFNGERLFEYDVKRGAEVVEMV